MIDCVTWSNAHLFGEALAEQYRLRYRVFVEEQGWNVPHAHGMEWDQYDTPAAVYLIWRDPQGRARGVVRASPTSHPYMLADIWPGLVTARPLPRSDRIWEGTRLGVDSSLSPRLRRQISNELVVGMIELGLSMDLEGFVHVTPVSLVRSVFWRNGFSTQPLGPESAIDGIPTLACLTPVTLAELANIRAGTGNHVSVLNTLFLESTKAA